MTYSIRLNRGSHKSIEAPFSWEMINNFAVLFGENGAGKTHLIEFVQLLISRSSNDRGSIEFSDGNPNLQDIVFINGLGQNLKTVNISSSPRAQFSQERDGLPNVFTIYHDKYRSGGFKNEAQHRSSEPDFDVSAKL